MGRRGCSEEWYRRMENAPRFNIEDHDYQTEGQKYVWCKGLRFARDEKTGYYLNSSNHVRLHVFVWEQANCKVPKGYHVHHDNGDKNDNRLINLRLMSRREHIILHGKNLTAEEREWRRRNLAEKARPKASDWHRSEEGRKWHKEQARQLSKKMLAQKIEHICTVCGKHYFSHHHDGKFCSPNCKTKGRKRTGIDNVQRICVICGNTFIADKNNKTRTCSIRCRAQLRKKVMRGEMKRSDMFKAKEIQNCGTPKQLTLGI